MADLDIRDSVTNLQSPAKGIDEHLHVAASPSDAESVSVPHTFTIKCIGVWIGVDGDLQVTMRSGTQVTFANIVAGFYPLDIISVDAGTTAGSIIGVSYA